VGGLAKNPLLMQIYADVTHLPLSVATSTQGPAVGSAIHAAVAAGAYPDVAAAAAVMGSKSVAVFVPNPENAAAYDVLFAEYTALHDHFGRGGSSVMRRLKGIKRDAVGRRRAAEKDSRAAEKDSRAAEEDSRAAEEDSRAAEEDVAVSDTEQGAFG
ncbi:MAG: FGGY-family carbohydrate kinase, partial [Nakamurella sp.]